MNLIFKLWLALFAVTSVFGAPSKEAAGPVRVLAAASLSGVMPKVAELFKQSGGGAVEFSFDASSRLAKQIEQGAPADLYFSADREWMDYLDGRGKIESSTRKDFLNNELVAAVPQKAAFVPKTAEELKSPQIKRLALAGENVPISKYAKAALEKEKVWSLVQSKIVRGDHVRTALRWVAEETADAAIVYRTDVMDEPRARVAFVFPSTDYPPVVYPGALIKESRRAGAAQAFLKFCGEMTAQQVFRDAGFHPIQKLP